MVRKTKEKILTEDFWVLGGFFFTMRWKSHGYSKKARIFDATLLFLCLILWKLTSRRANKPILSFICFVL